MPRRAPRPDATTMAIGVARPSAHGHAMTSTARAGENQSAPRSHHPSPVARDSTTTAGTNHAEIRSTRRWTSALSARASRTRRTIPASAVASPTADASTTSRPDTATVPPTTGSPTSASAGTGSPVSMLRSTAERPDTTRPSAAIFSPGRTTNRAPTTSSPTGTRRSVPSSSSTVTSRAASRASAASASPEARRARRST